MKKGAAAPRGPRLFLTSPMTLISLSQEERRKQRDVAIAFAEWGSRNGVQATGVENPNVPL